MTSNDNVMDMSTVTLILNELSGMRQENADFRREIKQDISEFKAEIRSDIAKLSDKVEVLQSQIGVMQNDMTGLKHDVAGLYHWDYWLLSIILVIFAMPQIVAGVKSLFSAIAEGLGLIASVLRGTGKKGDD